MKVGDLVRYISPAGRWGASWSLPGIVLRCIPGTDERKVVQWTDGTRSSYPASNLEVIHENR
jgi:hypothetical protein